MIFTPLTPQRSAIPPPSPSAILTTMAVPSTFQERLQQMEETRNQRLSHLQAERDLQLRKSQLLSFKLSNLRCVQQRCLLLERRHAELGFQILAKKSEIDALDVRYHAAAQELRSVKSSIEEIVGREKEWDRFYDAKRLEIEDFKETRKKFLSDSRAELQNSRNLVSELKSTLKDLQCSDGYSVNADLAAAEARKADLLAKKEKLDKNLASAYRFRTVLQKHLQKVFLSQDKEVKTEREQVKMVIGT